MKYSAAFILPTVSLFLTLSLFLSCTETQTAPMSPSDEPDNQTDPFTETVGTIKRPETIVTFSHPSPECNILIFEDDDFHYDKNESIPPPNPEPIHIDAFTELSELRQHFQSTLFADNFRLLRLLTDSQNYLAFLSDVSPQNVPYQTLDSFWKVQPPSTEEILSLFDGLLKSPTEKQIDYVHSQILSWQCSFFDTFFHLSSANHCELNPQYPLRFIPEPPDREHMRNAIYFATRRSPLDLIGEELDAHWMDTLRERYKRYAEDTLEIHQKKIRGFFNTYGADTGMIWLAVQEPNLTGFILSNFIHENMLKAWIKDGYARATK